jgi:hypothetical protein
LTNAELAKRAVIAIEHMSAQLNCWARVMALGASKYPDGSDDALGFLEPMNEAMNTIGDILNNFDAVDDEDERSTSLVFSEMKKMFPGNDTQSASEQ